MVVWNHPRHGIISGVNGINDSIVDVLKISSKITEAYNVLAENSVNMGSTGNTDLDLTELTPYYRDCMGLKNNIFGFSDSYRLDSGRYTLLAGDNPPTSRFMPASFLVPQYKNDGSNDAHITKLWQGVSDTTDVEQMEERRMVHYMTNIYDASVWQMSLALLKNAGHIAADYGESQRYQSAYGNGRDGAGKWSDIDYYNSMIRAGYLTQFIEANVSNARYNLEYTAEGYPYFPDGASTDATEFGYTFKDKIQISSDTMKLYSFGNTEGGDLAHADYVYPSKVQTPFRFRAISYQPFDGSIDPVLTKELRTSNAQTPEYYLNSSGIPYVYQYQTQYGWINAGWKDYLPVLGENAWAFFLGPLQTLYVKRNGYTSGQPLVPETSQICLSDMEMCMAIEMLPTIEAMAASFPLRFTDGTSVDAIAVYYAPGGTFQRNGFTNSIRVSDISNENNASLFAGLNVFATTLREIQYKYTGERLSYIKDLISRLEVLLVGISNYFRYLALTMKNMGGNDYFFLCQGGSVLNGVFYKNDQPALDCQTWPLHAFMSTPFGSLHDPETWWQSNEKVIEGEYAYMNDIISEFQAVRDATGHKNNCMTIWENSKRLFGTYTDDGTNFSSVAAATSPVSGVGYTMKAHVNPGGHTVFYYRPDGTTYQGNDYDAEDNAVISAEWTAGAIFLTRMIHQRFGIQQAKDDYDTMVTGVNLTCRNVFKNMNGQDLSGVGDMYHGITAYSYSSERTIIPFGWNANAFPSMASTGWMVFERMNFNPYGYGGHFTVSLPQ